MAKIIPERPAENTLSSAELKLYNIFKNMPGTDSWVVLHSLAIAKHTTQSQGEADFLVVIPDLGSFVLEVKGGGISCKDGQWYSVDRNDVEYLIKNPINEANNAMHSIMDYVSANASLSMLNIKKTLFGFGVIFPDCSFHGIYSSLEIADEQIADCDDCLTSVAMKSYLLRLAEFWKRRHESTQDGQRKNKKLIPDASMARELVNLLRPRYIPRVSIKSVINALENQVIELTDNQQDVFDTISENERCLVKGDAGTGKTVIALHFAKEKIRTNKNIAFFCYNKQLAEYLNENLDDGSSLLCDSFTEYMISVVKEAGEEITIPEAYNERNEFYNNTLPDLFLNAFIKLEKPLFDTVIVDEAQDLMHPQYLDMIDVILKGGLERGNWYFFMDSERQDLYHQSSHVSVTDLKQKYYFTTATLRDNCRNSVAIIELVDTIFGIKTRHKNHDERGLDVAIKSYRKTLEQAKKIEDALLELEADSVPKENIVILSPHKYEKSVASILTPGVVTLSKHERKNKIFFSTIHGFKGLESSVVILVDIDNLSHQQRMDLLYVGMTRAKSVLYIFVDEKIQKILKK